MIGCPVDDALDVNTVCYFRVKINCSIVSDLTLCTHMTSCDALLHCDAVAMYELGIDFSPQHFLLL